jgi:uncharacterized phage protein (TIGR02216 family)
MKRGGGFNWAELMLVGLHHLRLQPNEFWNLTPAELLVMAGAVKPASQLLTRQGLNELCALFPDN